ncbi:lipopolysaccharide biosynthesis protein [Novosphingobium sp. B 225]|uniref:lipopolysaccharide biosynthesis protein n=1 Tax=Novosphingobium sp. B 225 TaxID=1961849 RepID=UPI000B4A822F|nr:lipopolysaccharide biosynthesis protein [Novosphingobium sp. B 225]
MSTLSEAAAPDASLRSQVRSAVIWRSGTQVFSQLLSWASTFLVIRILAPADYGLFAMTSVVLVLLGLLNGYGFANAAIQDRAGGKTQLRQLFGLLIVVNGALAAVQFLTAPLVAAYYQQPQVTALLQVQALIYLTNPFLALGYAVLSREMDFRKQAQVNVGSAILSALVALAGAMAGLGVWTLIVAPLTGFVTRALGMMTVARAWMWPSFNFRGSRALADYGGIVMAGQVFWFLQTQADIIIAGRMLPAHELGFYTTSLFLAQIFVNKVVPPLNEVAFSAYARMQDDRAALAEGFLTKVRAIMLLSIPFCLGLAAVAEPAIQVMLGEKWLPAAPVVRLLALTMPFMTLHVLFAPATNAVGRPGIATRSAVLGSIVMPLAFYLGVRWGGAEGIAAGWLLGYPIITFVTALWAMPVLGVTMARLGQSLLPTVLAGSAMAMVVTLVDQAAHGLHPAARLLVLVAAGGATYGLWLLGFARERLAEAWALVRKK